MLKKWIARAWLVTVGGVALAGFAASIIKSVLSVGPEWFLGATMYLVICIVFAASVYWAAKNAE